MRPVFRGEIPKEYEDLIKEEAPKEDVRYRQARPFLEKAIGSYCSYCEMRMTDTPDVEHILPKSQYPKLRNDWNNFLLACDTCNRSEKKDKVADLNVTAFPHKDNTFRCFVYQEGRVKLADLDDPLEREAAKNLNILVSIDKIGADRRYLCRESSYIAARDTQKEYAKGKATLESILRACS